MKIENSFNFILGLINIFDSIIIMSIISNPYVAFSFKIICLGISFTALVIGILFVIDSIEPKPVANTSICRVPPKG
jgi:hypothetical protein